MAAPRSVRSTSTRTPRRGIAPQCRRRAAADDHSSRGSFMRAHAHASATRRTRGDRRAMVHREFGDQTRPTYRPRTSGSAGATRSRIEIRLEEARAHLSGAGGPWLDTVSAAVPALSSSATRTGAVPREGSQTRFHRLVGTARRVGERIPPRPAPGRQLERELAADRRADSLRRSRGNPPGRSVSRSTWRRLCSRREASVMRSRCGEPRSLSARSIYRRGILPPSFRF